jgi:CheY-like chemotaxis protein
MSLPDVLIVDDDRLLRTMLKDALADVPCNVREADSGDAAVVAIAEKQPQVMLLALGSENARRALIVEGPHLGLEGGLALAHGGARAFGVQSKFKLTQL